MRAVRPVSYAALRVCILSLCVFAGCADGVQEDRTVTWSADGGAAGFQHGNEGLFLANRETGNLENIFQPDENVLATSTPLWSPVDKRLVFTTAQAAKQNQPSQAAEQDQPDPPSIEETQVVWNLTSAGRTYWKQPIVYTCWLREEPEGGEATKPTKLFDAACDHVGYVAANLAVRWHPGGDRIVYVDQVADGMHALFEYDLADRAKRRIFAHSAAGIIFDWTPDGSRLVCVLGGSEGSHENDGIWIGRPDTNDWWHVPRWGKLGESEQTQLIATLRARRPAWTLNGAQFAFVLRKPGSPGGHQPGQSLLYRGTPDTRKVELLLSTDEPIRDLYWSPDQRRIGFVRGVDVPSLHLLSPPRAETKPVNERPVRRFVGWDATGHRLAYIVPDAVPPTESDTWTFLFFPNPHARDAVYVTDGGGTNPGRVVFSGLGVTFPRLSPTEEKLSLWATFHPTYQSWLSRFFGWGLQPGDPAAVLDMQTGNMEWMAVNAPEKVQVGHYYLLKRNYAEARQWYDEAAAELPTSEPVTVDNFTERLRGPRNFAFFHYYCLEKLGLNEQARSKLSEFTRSYRLSSPGNAPEDSVQSVPPDRRSREQIAFLFALARNMYMAEIFLSLDAGNDGRKFFDAFMSQAETDTDRLTAAIVLGQLLLLDKKHEEYAELATGSIAPLAMTVWKDRTATPAGVEQNGGLQRQSPLVFGVGLSLLPMYSPEFLATLPVEQLQALVPKWQSLRSETRNDITQLGVDLFLRAAYQQLGRQQDEQTMASRIEHNPSRAGLLPPVGLAGLIQELRKLQATTAP